MLLDHDPVYGLKREKKNKHTHTDMPTFEIKKGTKEHTKFLRLEPVLNDALKLFFKKSKLYTKAYGQAALKVSSLFGLWKNMCNEGAVSKLSRMERVWKTSEIPSVRCMPCHRTPFAVNSRHNPWHVFEIAP